MRTNSEEALSQARSLSPSPLEVNPLSGKRTMMPVDSFNVFRAATGWVRHYSRPSVSTDD